MTFQFENLRMSKYESVTVFSSTLNSIANEAIMMSKNYKDKKFVKKNYPGFPEKLALPTKHC